MKNKCFLIVRLTIGKHWLAFISRTTSNLSFCLTSNHLSIPDAHKISRDTCRFSLHSQMNDLYMEF